MKIKDLKKILERYDEDTDVVNTEHHILHSHGIGFGFGDENARLILVFLKKNKDTK